LNRPFFCRAGQPRKETSIPKPRRPSASSTGSNTLAMSSKSNRSPPELRGRFARPRGRAPPHRPRFQWRLPSRSSGGPLVRDHVAGVAETVAIFVRVDPGIEPHAIRLTTSGTRLHGRSHSARRSGIRHDRTGVESRHHLAAPNGFKSKQIRDILCRHWGAQRFSDKWLLYKDFR
jgi:hypothetical protein